MTDAAPVRVFLVDDHILFRKGIASLLATHPSFEVAGEAASGTEALAQIPDTMPDLVLMDIAMPGMDGIEATRRLKERLPALRIIMLTMADNDQNVFEAIKSGAQGYLLKEVDAATFFTTLQAVQRGEAYLSGAMAAKVLEEFARQAPRPAADDSPLSLREQEVLTLIAQGHSNKQIATQLCIADSTVKNHLRNILAKLELDNRVQAAAYALKKYYGSPENKRTAGGPADGTDRPK